MKFTFGFIKNYRNKAEDKVWLLFIQPKERVYMLCKMTAKPNNS